MTEEQRDILKKDIESFIKTELKDESKENLKHKILGWGSAALATIVIILMFVFFIKIILGNGSGALIAGIAGGGILLFLALSWFGAIEIMKSKLTTKANTKKVKEQLHKFFEQFLATVKPGAKIESIEVKKLGANAIGLDVAGQKYFCATNTVIRKERRREFFAGSDGRRDVRTRYYYDTTLDVTISVKPVGLTGIIEIKKGNTSEGKEGKFASESIDFNKKFDIDASIEDGFKFFTPKKVESFMVNADQINENSYQVKEGQLSFGKKWTVRKTNKRAKEIAAKDIDKLSASDDKMLNQIMNYIESSITLSIKYLDVVSAMIQ